MKFKDKKRPYKYRELDKKNVKDFTSRGDFVSIEMYKLLTLTLELWKPLFHFNK